MDGHSSHVGLQFLTKADIFQIIVLVLPSHSTHRLQPLDVGLFSPLSQAYTQELNNLMHKSLGLVSMTKRLFWPMFKAAWEKSFTEKNILSAFEKTGIWPYKPERTIAIIEKPKVSELLSTQSNLATPINCRSVRQIQKSYAIASTKSKLELIFRSMVKLSTLHLTDLHITSGLIESFALEKKKRKRGRNLGLLQEGNLGEAQLYSPDKIKKAKQLQAEKDVEKELEQLNKEARKATAAALRIRKEAAKEERALQRAARAQEAKEAKAIKAAEVLARKQDREAKKQAAEAQKAISPTVLRAFSWDCLGRGSI